MTRNQLAYQANVEAARHNIELEKETHRNNVAVLDETNRHNVVYENETYRHNKASEDIQTNVNAINAAHYAAIDAENARHNKMSEQLQQAYNIEVATHNRHAEYETGRHNVQTEGIQRVGNDINALNANTNKNRSEIESKLTNARTEQTKVQTSAIPYTTASDFMSSIGGLINNIGKTVALFGL